VLRSIIRLLVKIPEIEIKKNFLTCSVFFCKTLKVKFAWPRYDTTVKNPYDIVELTIGDASSK
jgi:hypothetical protein